MTTTAFRSVLAAPGQKLVVALVDPGQDLGSLQSLARELSVKLVVYGETGTDFPKDSNVAYLDSWARPLLSSVLSVADAVVPLAKGSEKWLSGERVSTVCRDLESVRTLLDPASPNRLVLHNDWGIGDEVLLSAVAREIVRVRPDMEIWIRSRHGFRFPAYVRQGAPPAKVRRVETIYQNPVLYGPSSHSPFPGHLVQQMLDKVALDTGLRIVAGEVRPQLDIRPVSRTAHPTVTLHTRTNPRLPSKDWGLGRWLRLAQLLQSSGLRLRQVGAKDDPLIPGAEDLRGRPVSDLPETIAESWAVVCVVGVLMHLAEAARTPAVVIYGGREHPAIDGYPDQVHLSSGPLPCRGRWGCHLAPDLDCVHGMKCMEQLSPELVAREVLGLVGRR